jgi:hypothetical protein
MRITSAGNVGIGTTAPAQKLSVAGAITSVNAGETIDINTDGNNPAIELRDGDGTGMTPFIDFSNDGATDFDARLQLNGDDILSIQGASLGVGTTAPAQVLHVVGNARITGLDQNANRVVMVDANGDLFPSSSLVGSGLGDNLGNHTATTNLNMSNNEIDNVSFLDVTAGVGNGIRFWSDNAYAINMGNTSEFQFGPVSDYSIKMNMNNNSARGWTWGVDGVAPVAALNTTGNMQVAGNMTSNGHFYGRSSNGTYSNIYRMGGIYFTWDSDSYGTNDHHSIRSTYGDTYGDNITLNSYNHIRFNMDANANNPTSYFELGDNTTGVGNTIFRIETGGDIALNGKHAIRSNDSWLRLNQDGAFASGTYTPGHFRSDGGITSGGSGSPGAGNIRATGLAGGGNRIVLTDNNGTLYPVANLIGSGLGDNLGNHSATTTLDMNANAIIEAGRFEPYGIGGNSGQAAHSYAIFQEAGAWSSPYPDLRIAFHTGIKLGAYYGYNGTRFYNNSDMATEIFSVGNGDNYVRSLYGHYAPWYGDYNDGGYYLDPNSTSNSALRIRGGALHGPNPTWGAYLLVGGDGRNGYIDNGSTASVSTTNGNLHLDAASGYDTYINYYDGGQIYFGRGNNSTRALLNANGFYLYDGWFRTDGDEGWYNESYGGGIYMTNSTYVRTYNSKPLQSNGLLFQDEYDLRTAGDGVIFRYAGQASMAFDDELRFYDSNNAAYRMVMNVDDGSMRAQVFYDFNDTYYHADLNGWQRMTGDMYACHTAGVLRVGHASDLGDWCCGGYDWWGCQGWCEGFKLSVNGSAEAHGWYGWSDGRFKTNIQQVTGAVDLVKSMRGVFYDWAWDEGASHEDKIRMGMKNEYVKGAKEAPPGSQPGRRIGVIAQEVKEILPQLVRQVEDKDDSGEVIGYHLSVNYDDIVPVLIEAIKEQQDQIDELKQLVLAGSGQQPSSYGSAFLADVQRCKAALVESDISGKSTYQEFLNRIEGYTTLSAVDQSKLNMIKNLLNIR